MGIEKNTVAAANQLAESKQLYTVSRSGAHRVLFVGNSITRHGYKPDIGWYGDWGMAASAIEKDYVHQTLALLEPSLGKVDYCVLNIAEWERKYWDDSVLCRWQDARDFEADVVIIRVGENIWGVKERLKEFDLYPHFDAMVRFFSKNPKAQILVSDLFWAKEELDGVIRRVIADNGYTYVPLGDLGEADENKAIGLFEHSGVSHHPSDLGMRRIAERIVERIRV